MCMMYFYKTNGLYHRKRELYTQQIRPFIGKDVVKVIPGMSRSGKIEGSFSLRLAKNSYPTISRNNSFNLSQPALFSFGSASIFAFKVTRLASIYSFNASILLPSPISGVFDFSSKRCAIIYCISVSSSASTNSENNIGGGQFLSKIHLQASSGRTT